MGASFPPLKCTMFFLLTLLDVVLQYSLLTSWGPQVIEHDGGSSISVHALNYHSTGFIGHTPYHGVIWATCLGSLSRQLLWMIFIAKDFMTVQTAITICAANSFLLVLNHLISLYLATSGAPIVRSGDSLPLHVYIGAALYIVGMIMELASEVQHQCVCNEQKYGDICRGEGWPRMARNFNYTGRLLWHGGHAPTAGGWPWGLAVVAAQVFGSISELDPKQAL